MLTTLQKKTAQAIVNIFETGRALGDYGSVAVLKGDNTNLAYGRSQTTLASGDLSLLLRAYCEAGGKYAEPFAQYLPAFESRDENLSKNVEVKSLLIKAGHDPIMIKVQDDLFDTKYWEPALKLADETGVKKPLGVAVVYDSAIHGSYAKTRELTEKEFGLASDTGEEKWIKSYVSVRRGWINNHSNKLVRKTLYRMDEFNKLIDAGKWDLSLPLNVRDVVINEELFKKPYVPHTADSAPDYGTRVLYYTQPMMRGQDVLNLQTALSLPNHECDGIFGRGTDKAVRLFQKKHGLEVNGKVDPAMWASLSSSRSGEIGSSPEDTEIPSGNETTPGMPDQTVNTGEVNVEIPVPEVNQTDTVTSPTGNPRRKLDSDRWTAEDKLGYEPYARAIAELITSPSTGLPLTVGVKAAWGAGKTSLMKRVQVLLDRRAEIEAFNEVEAKPLCWEVWCMRADDFRCFVIDVLRGIVSWPIRTECKGNPLSIKPESSYRGRAVGIEARHTIWFNAWKYQTAEQIWAGLAHAIITQVTEKMDPFQRERFWFKLHASRTDISKIRLEAFKLVISELMPGGLLLALLALGLLLYGLFPFGAGDVSLPTSITGAVILSLQTLKAWKEHMGKVSCLVKDSVQEHSYKDKAGFLHLVEYDMKNVLNIATRDGKPLVIFVDDLDRCSPTKVAEVIEGINLFLSCEYPNTVFVLGMEPIMVAAALNVANEKVITALKEFQDDDGHSPLGWRFMEKVVQLPVVVPPPTDEGVEDYLDFLVGKPEKETDAVGPQSSEEEASPTEEVVEKYRAELAAEKSYEAAHEKSKEFMKSAPVKDKAAVKEAIKREEVRKLEESDPFMREFIKSAGEHFRDNPRQIKRFTNLFRFYMIIKINLRAEMMHKGKDVTTLPEEETIFKYVLMLANWPLAVDFMRERCVVSCSPPAMNLLHYLEMRARELDDEHWYGLVCNVAETHKSWAATTDFREFLASGLTIGDKTGNGLW